MSINTAKNGLVVHGDLQELAYLRKKDLQLEVGSVGCAVEGQHWLRTDVNSINTGLSATTGRTYYTPIRLPRVMVLDALNIFSGVSHTGTSSVRLGLWSDDPTTNKPAALLKDAGTVSITSNNTSYTTSFTGLTLAAGIYWVGCNTISASGVLQFQGVSATSTAFNLIIGASSSAASGDFIQGYYETYTATSSFTNAGTLSFSTATPFVSARVQP